MCWKSCAEQRTVADKNI